jgi:hypothetical protein
VAYIQYCCQTTTTTGSCCTTNIWPTWIDNQSTSTIGNNIWSQWSNSTVTLSNAIYTCENNIASPRIYQPPTETPEQLEIRLIANEERVKERKECEDKAMELLKENLLPKQKEALNKHGWFLVEGGKSKKTYRIKANGYSGNISELDGELTVARLCVHAKDNVPLGDHLLAQALHLQWDEDYILSKANRSAA